MCLPYNIPASPRTWSLKWRPRCDPASSPAPPRKGDLLNRVTRKKRIAVDFRSPERLSDNRTLSSGSKSQETRRRTMKYICFGYYDKDKFDGMAEGERNGMFDTCLEYDDHLRANGHWVGGEALQPAETALTLSWKNGKVATTDGPYAETKEHLGGILVLEARDMNHAIQLMSQHPAVKYGTIFEIRPTGDMSEIMKASEQRRRKLTAR